MLLLSRVKSPVTIATPAVNEPFSKEELRQAQLEPQSSTHSVQLAQTNAAPSTTRVEDYAALSKKPVVVLVCLSGGGARAARMAAHTLAQLEEIYNESDPDYAREHPLSGVVDGWSSVSGGSVYASYVASQLKERGPKTNTFDTLLNGRRIRFGTQKAGALATLFYLWPGNVGYAPIAQVFTEWDTLHLFSRTHAMLQEGRLPILPISRLLKLGDLPPHPIFLFNATCQQTARPFVFTQSIIHRDLTGDPLWRLGEDSLVQWIKDRPFEPGSEPLLNATTLEDLGSSPGRFPLSYAVMASAAYPGVFQPLTLNHYRYASAPNESTDLDEEFDAPYASDGAKSRHQLWWRRHQVTIVDGGVYDNTGLATAVQLFDYLQTRRAQGITNKLVLLSIDANIVPDGYSGLHEPSRLPLRYDLPLRGMASAFTTIIKIYSKQQSLVNAAVDHRIEKLQKEGYVDFYRVRLMDLIDKFETHSKNKETFINSSTGLIKETGEAARQINEAWLNNLLSVRSIPTDLVITGKEDAKLKNAVRVLLESTPEYRFKIGLTNSTGQAFVQAIKAIGPTN